MPMLIAGVGWGQVEEEVLSGLAWGCPNINEGCQHFLVT